jgi:hypothetical protein
MVYQEEFVMHIISVMCIRAGLSIRVFADTGQQQAVHRSTTLVVRQPGKLSVAENVRRPLNGR